MDKAYRNIKVKKGIKVEGIIEKKPITLFLWTSVNRTQQITSDSTFEVLTKREYLQST